MHNAVSVVYEKARGCGYRKSGGLYFRCDGLSMACGRFPIPLDVCPTCGQGIKPARGYTWIEPLALVAETRRACVTPRRCGKCAVEAVLAGEIRRVGLLWVGEKFYPSTYDFLSEASEMGVSRRIPGNQVPRGLVVGETWIMLAHRRAIAHAEFGKDVTYTPGIFAMFKPSRIEIVVDGTESDEQIESFLKRGLSPVLVRHAEEQAELL